MSKNDQQFMAQKIRAQYMEKQSTELDELRGLDTKVKRPANVFAYSFGSVSAIIMGCGMSLVMTDIADTIGLSGDPMTTGIIIGGSGLAMALLTSPLYKGVLNSRKKKYSDQIVSLSEKIMNQKAE